MALPHFPRGRRAAALLVAGLLLAAAAASAQIMLPRWEAETVAGQPGRPGTIAGGPAVSRLTNPQALCASPLDAANPQLLVGTSEFFRTFSTTDNNTGTWFGAKSGSDLVGPIANVRLPTLYGCALAGTTVYYVSGTGGQGVFSVTDGIVTEHAVSLDQNIFLTQVAVFQNFLYIIDLSPTIHRCQITPANPAPTNCLSFPVGNTVNNGNVAQRGISVNARGVFIATSNRLVWCPLDLDVVGCSGTVFDDSAQFTDVHTAPPVLGSSTTTLIAASPVGVYRVTITSAAPAWSVEFIAGSQTGGATCNPAQNSNVHPPTFCSIYRVFALDAENVYLSITWQSILRYLHLPPVSVLYTFDRRPFPIGFDKGERINAQLRNLMDHQLVGADLLGPGGGSVNPDGALVELEWWDSVFQVMVPQTLFDVTTTRPLIDSAVFTTTLQDLTEYYELTNFTVMSDFNLLPTCNRTSMNTIEHDIANRARVGLSYPLVYTDPAVTTTINDNPNITQVKLLMPSAFGFFELGDTFNETTYPALVDTGLFPGPGHVLDAFARNLSESFLTPAVVATYPPEHVYTLNFSPMATYNFDQLSEEQLQQIRWFIQSQVEDQLRSCVPAGEPLDGGQSAYLDANPGSNGPDGRDGLFPGCVPKIGITNNTRYEVIGTNPAGTNYTVLIPETMAYPHIQECLDQFDKSTIPDWIENNTPVHYRRTCNTGCIVGVAVASAVVAAVLMVVLVIVVSKRRRLATVVAPAAVGAEPKFASTLEDDDGEYSTGNGNGNPLER